MQRAASISLDGVEMSGPKAAIDFLGNSRNRRLGVASDRSPLGIITPKSQAEIELAVRWANKTSTPLFPVSSPGGPRRFGEHNLRAPFYVLDLSKMSSVLRADERDGIAVIESGVTFLQFDQELKAHGLRSIKPLLPRRTKSVLSCFLEREPPISFNDHWDTTDPLAAMSVVFGSGETFKTGAAALPGDFDENYERGLRPISSIGPMGTDYSRLLMGAQGTLGVVCWASIHCEKIPTREEGQLFGSAQIAPLLSMVREMALRKLGQHVFILSRTQFAAALSETNAEFQRHLNSDYPKWLLYVSVPAPNLRPEQGVRWRLAQLSKIAHEARVTSLTAANGQALDLLKDRIATPPDRFYKTVPTGEHTDAFCVAQLSRVGGLVSDIEHMLEAEGALNDDLHAGIYVQPTVQGVSCHVEVTLFHNDLSSSKAASLEKQVIETMATKGGFLSRPYGDWNEQAFARAPDIVPHLRRVKNMFDPAGVLAPGRLCFGEG